MNPAGRWILVGLSGTPARREFILSAPEVRIGRTEENDIALPESNVSRFHAMIRTDPTACRIEDLASKNGIFVNDQRVTVAALNAGDTLRIGEARFRVAWEADGERWLDRLQILTQRLRSDRRARIYGFALLTLLIPIVIWLRPSPRIQALPSTDPVSDRPIESGANGTRLDETAAETQADLALRRDDLLAAIPLLRQLAVARPWDLSIRVRLEKAEARRQALIARYYENGVREYEKLEYDRSIREWQKSAALSEGFDPKSHELAVAKIHEAEEKLRPSSRR